jgi:hypothetical protein
MIPIKLRISAALRYFAGGRSAYDIMLSHHISHHISRTSFYTAVWDTVEAVNKCKTLDIVFPETHEEQVRVAAQFKSKSDVDITT